MNKNNRFNHKGKIVMNEINSNTIDLDKDVSCISKMCQNIENEPFRPLMKNIFLQECW